MNKNDLIAAVAKNSNLPKPEIADIITRTLEEIQKAVINGDKVAIVGFATIELAHRAARQAHNPSTGEKVPVPAKWTPKLRPAQWWTEAATKTQGGLK